MGSSVMHAAPTYGSAATAAPTAARANHMKADMSDRDTGVSPVLEVTRARGTPVSAGDSMARLVEINVPRLLRLLGKSTVIILIILLPNGAGRVFCRLACDADVHR